MLRTYQKILVVLLLISTNMYSQTPCSDGFATVSGSEIYPCNDYDLLSRMPISTLATTAGTPEGSDAWGWTDPMDGKEYAIMATTNSTAFIDISDPVNPIFLGRINTTGTSTSIWRDVKIYNNYAFIVADNIGAHGMQVFDLTLLRNGPEVDETFEPNITYTGIDSCHNIIINESEAIAYLVGCNTYNGGPNFIDISDPLNPVSLGGFSNQGYTHDAQVITYTGPDTDYTNREIFIGSNGTFSGTDKIVILDVTDKNNIIEVSDITYTPSGYTHQGWFTDDQRYFIFGDETDEQGFGFNTKTLVLDLVDLDNPILSSTYYGPSAAIDHNGYVKGNKFYLANYRAGVRILDITNISSSTNPMTEIGYFDTYPANDNTNYNGAWSVYPYFPSGNIIISDIERGMFIIRQSGTLTTNETQLNSFFTISPNPTINNPIINASQNQSIKTIELYNIIGQKVFFKNNINVQEFVLPIQDYAKGMYLIKINSTISKKIILK